MTKAATAPTWRRALTDARIAAPRGEAEARRPRQRRLVDDAVPIFAPAGRRPAGSIAGVKTPTVWHNPRCSKSRGALALLAERGIDPELVRYLDDAPDRAALEDVLRKIGTDDPRAIIRTGEPRYRELGLAGADRDALLDALVAEPALIERPIVVIGERAVVARPPERLLELLGEG